MIELKVLSKKKLKNYRLIEGFPGIGLVGAISASYLAEKMNMEQIAYLYSEKFPPMASIHKGRPIYPVRMYADHKNKLIVLYSDFVIPANSVYEVTNEVFSFVKKHGISEIISLAGMTSTFVQEEKQVFAIISGDKVKNKLKKLGIKFVQEGVTTGVSGMLLARCAMENVPAFSLLVESAAGYPDPGASAVLLHKLGEYLKISIETKSLEEEAKNIQERIQKTLEQIRLGKVKYKQAEEHLPMYG